MIKKKIIAIIGAVAIIVCGIIIVPMIKNIDELPENPTSATSISINHDNEKITLFKCNIYDIASARIENEQDDYSFARTVSSDVYMVGRENVKLDKNAAKLLYASLNEIYCQLSIEKNASDVSIYGLDKPQAKLSLYMNDGQVVSFEVGDSAPLGDGFYCRMSNSNDVYLTSAAFARRFLKSHTEFYEMCISTEASFTSGFENISIKPFGGEEIYIRKATSKESEMLRYYGGTVVEKPFHSGGVYSSVESVMDTLCFFEAKSIVTDDITPAILSEYGFDTPSKVVLNVKADTKSAYSNVTGKVNPYYNPEDTVGYVNVRDEYTIGKSDGQTIYVMYKDIPVIYAVDKSVFAFLADKADVYCSDMFALQRISDLTSLEINYGGQNYYFDIKGSDTDEMKVSCNGFGDVDEIAFRNFYVTILSVTRDGLAEEEPAESCPVIMKITYGMRDGTKMTLEFIQTQERVAVVKVDGEGRFYTYKTKTDKIAEQMLALLGL